MGSTIVPQSVPQAEGGTEHTPNRDLERATGLELGSGRRTLTVDEAARALGISRSTAYECVRNGSLPSLRFRRRIVISAIVIERLLDLSATTEDGSNQASSAG